jgi:hypothetical protein
MNDESDEIKRWTARRKASVVMDIIKGKTTAAGSHVPRQNITLLLNKRLHGAGKGDFGGVSRLGILRELTSQTASQI